MRREKWVLGFLAELIVFGVVFTVVSALRSYVVMVPRYPRPIPFLGVGYGRTLLFPMVYYGFPEPWFTREWAATYSGGLRYGFLPLGFVLDILFYALLLFPPLLMSLWARWERQKSLQRIPDD